MTATTLHTGRLVLTPEDPYQIPKNQSSLFQHLQKIGFIAEGLETEGKKFLLGERFLQLVSFMGCSPNIQLEPNSAGKPFCHLIVSGPDPLPQFLKGRNTTPPRCEQCKKRLPDWQTTIQAWKEDPRHFIATCSHCNHRQNPASYNWRQSAGSGRFMLLVENIFPQEAIPSTELLKVLQTTTRNKSWHYFYVQDD
ncbi:MAG: hypothetical protein LC541_02155 [Candidatus Thiodiazotropha sp.]|nr:hypothetical protein [Candidatus Thiodiazotropha sp.]MCM8882124.1 hypothetical protein [Candidatus Thiodiazotropha sp.]MCM8919099.1 hypothetical protein [Candidatus Thiodiazotropha sp.]